MRTRKLGLLLVCLLFGTSAWAQSITRQSVVLSAGGRPVPGAKIYVCTGAVTVNFQVTPPCSPAQTIYSDYATTQPITQPLVSDGLGNYLYYLPTSATTVTEVITGTGINSSSTVLTFAAGGGGASNLGQLNGGTAPASQAFNFNSSGTSVTLPLVGNGAVKPAASDAVQYVSANGNDANDGLSKGSSKLTPQSAINALPACGTSTHCGTVWISPSTTAYTGPTTFYSGVYLRNSGNWTPPVIWSKFNVAAFNSFSSGPGSANMVKLSYSSSLTISDVSQIGIVGIDLDFGGSGGLTLTGVSWSQFEMAVTGAATTAPAITWNTDAGNSLNSIGNTAPWIVTEGGNRGILFGNGSGGSQGVTENHFGQIYILADAQPSGSFDAIDFAGQCDSNTFDNIHFWFSTAITAANGIVFNSSSTTADKDADGIVIHFYDETGASYTGSSITVNPSADNVLTTGVLLGSTKITQTAWSGNSSLSWNRMGDSFPSPGGQTQTVPTMIIDSGQTGFPSLYWKKNGTAEWDAFIDGSNNWFLNDQSTNHNIFEISQGAPAGSLFLNSSGCLQISSTGGFICNSGAGGTLAFTSTTSAQTFLGAIAMPGFSFPAPTDGFTATFQHTLTANRTFTYPDDAGTFMLVQGPLTAGDCLDAIDAWTAGDAGAACGSGGGGTPGGTNTAVQFNASGAFGGDAAKFFFNDVTGALTITGAMTTAANSFVLSQLVNPANAGDAICGNSTPAWSDCVPGVSGRTVSVTTDTLTNSDRQQMVTYNSASAVATSIATAASLGNSYVAYLRNVNSGTVTITPAVGSSINNGSSATVPEGYHCTLSSQDNVNYDLDCSGGILSAGTNITLTQTQFGTQIAASGVGAFAGGSGASFQDVTEIAAPASPAAGVERLWADSTTHTFSCKTSTGGNCAPSGGSGAFGGTNTQTVGYTLTSSDAGKLVVMNCAAACVLTAPATQPSTTFSAYVMSTNSNATFALGGTDTYNGTTTVPLLLPFTILKISADSASAANYVGAYNGLSFDGAHTATITPASGTSAIITAPSGDSLTVKTQGANSGLTLEANGGDAVVGSLSSTKHLSLISGLEHSNITVTFSATPAFNAGQDEVFEMTLTGNVTSSTITNLGAGEFVTFSICQDATGGHTFAFPTSPTFRGAGTISSGAGTCSTQRFWYDGTDVKATAAMVTGE